MEVENGEGSLNHPVKSVCATGVQTSTIQSLARFRLYTIGPNFGAWQVQLVAYILGKYKLHYL